MCHAQLPLLVAPPVGVTSPADSASKSLADTLELAGLTILSSPWAMFGVGCATGVLVAGLVAALFGRRRRRAVLAEVEEAKREAERAKVAAIRADNRLQEALYQIENFQKMQNAQVVAAKKAKAESRLREEAEATAQTTRPFDSASVVDDTASLFVPLGYTPKHRRAEEVTAEIPKLSLDERLPRIEAEDEAVPAAPSEARLSQTDVIAEPEQSGEVVDPMDAEITAHVERLLIEEMEINRSGSARRFSRSHLRVFEGTGDLSAARRALQRKPRHLKAITKEA